MTTQLITAKPDTPAIEIKKIFESNSFHHLPILGPGQTLEGIVSREDFYKMSFSMSRQTTGKTWSDKQYETLPASHFMTATPMTLDPEDTIGLAADIFLANKFHALPIVEDDQLIGLLTSHDLLKYSFQSPVEAEQD